jgi:hypothetical protein
MKPWLAFGITWIVLFIGWLFLSGFTELFVGAVFAAIFGAICVGIGVLYFSLREGGSRIIGILITGLIGALFIEIGYWIYKRMGWTFLS